MQRTLALSLRAAFQVRLSAVAVAAIITLLIPSVQAHELIHREHGLEHHQDEMKPVAPEI